MRAAVPALLVAVAAVAASGTPAPAHQRAAVTVERPAEGAVVAGSALDVVLVAGTGQGPAEFTVRLDGQAVDTRGTVGPAAVFTTFRLQPGQRTRLDVALARPGAHELRVEPLPHGDDPQPPVVRRFSSVLPATTSPPAVGPTPRPDPDPEGRSTLLLVGAGVALLLLLAAAGWARRRR